MCDGGKRLKNVMRAGSRVGVRLCKRMRELCMSMSAQCTWRALRLRFALPLDLCDWHTQGAARGRAVRAPSPNRPLHDVLLEWQSTLQRLHHVTRFSKLAMCPLSELPQRNVCLR